MDTIIPKRFLPHLVLICVWVSLVAYGSITATVRSPVTVNPAFHVASAKTQCDPSITCSTLDVFQTSCSISGGTSVSCGSTTIQAGELYDVVVGVAGGASGSSHSWSAGSSGGVVTINPSTGSFTLDSSGAATFTVKVATVISVSGTDTVTVTVT